MERLLNINNKTYKAAKFDLNLLCDFEDSGISIEDISGKMFTVIRQYVSSSVGVTPREAGILISEHIDNGGSLEDISDVMSEMMQDSGFFRKTSKSKDKATSTRTRKKTEKEETEVTSEPSENI